MPPATSRRVVVKPITRNPFFRAGKNVVTVGFILSKMFGILSDFIAAGIIPHCTGGITLHFCKVSKAADA